MANTLRFLLALAIAAFIVHKGETLKCWKCNSMRDDMCSDTSLGSTINPADEGFMQDCESLPLSLLLPNGTFEETYLMDPKYQHVCVKATVAVQGLASNLREILRGCALIMRDVTTSSCTYHWDPHRRLGMLDTCYVCADDLCNGAAAPVQEPRPMLFSILP